jgi:hypothetical protein
LLAQRIITLNGQDKIAKAPKGQKRRAPDFKAYGITREFHTITDIGELIHIAIDHDGREPVAPRGRALVEINEVSIPVAAIVMTKGNGICTAAIISRLIGPFAFKACPRIGTVKPHCHSRGKQHSRNLHGSFHDISPKCISAKAANRLG